MSHKIEATGTLAGQILAGAFDGTPRAPVELARLLVDAHRTGLAGRERLDDALRTHVRDCLRSANARRVDIGLTHLEVTTRIGAPVAVSLVREAHDSVGDAAWAAWAKREPVAAGRMRVEVETVADQAARRIASATCGAG